MKMTQSQNQNRTVRSNSNSYRSGSARTTASQRMSRDEMRRMQAEARRKKKRRQQRLFYTVLLLIVIVVGVILSLTVFFHIDKILVEGESVYSYEQIVKASKVELNENLFMVNSKSISKNIRKSLPYIDNAEIVRKLPATVIIKVKDTKGSYAFLNNEGYIIVDSNGKVLQTKLEELPANVALIYGVELKEAKVGNTVKVTDENKLILVNKLAQGISSSDIKGITNIDVTDELKITMMYQNRIRLEFGSTAKYDKKIKMAAAALADQDKSNTIQTGVLDLTSDSGAVFRRENIFEEETTEAVTETTAAETTTEAVTQEKKS